MSDKPFVIKLLGTPEIIWNGKSLSLPRRQARALIYRLAVENQPVARDALLLLLWPDLANANARRNLTRLLSRIRQDLPDSQILETTRTTVALNANLVWSDAHAFDHMTQSDDVGQLEEGIALYRGMFLNGFSLSNSIEFDAWQSRQQYTYERRYLATLNKLVMAKQQLGQLLNAIEYAQRYLAVDELSEETHRQLISLYAQTGDRSAALLQFEQCVLILERELGVSPLPETRAAYEAARDNQQRLAPQKTPEPEWETLPSLDLPLIGRESAWQMLVEAYGRFQKGGVIFIAGAPGVGKSRLMQEFAETCPNLVLSGNNHAAEIAIPYQPLIQALRQALSLRSRWRHTLPIWLAELSRLMPELPTHFPDLPQPVEVEPQQAQARLFEALRQLFASLATDTPLLLCLDDVHWADESTRGWLQYISRQLVDSSICILATYRTHERATLQAWQRALQRTNLMTIVSLDGLSATAVANMLGQIQNSPADPQALATRIHAATGGNTFFVLETVRELIERGQLDASPATLPMPATVREAVLSRIEHLDPLTQQILEVTAVLSPTATFANISVAAGRDDMETANSLEELIARQLLRLDNEQFGFQHALARETIYQNISPWRRRLLHRRAANALVTLLQNEKVELATIAIHFESAGDMEQAVDHYWQAAKAAVTVYAYSEAINHLQRAIKLCNEIAAAPVDLLQLYAALADNLTITGQFAAAEETYRAALALVSNGDPLQLAELEWKLAATLSPQQQEKEAEMMYRAALARLDDPQATAVNPQTQSLRLNILLGLLDALYFQQRPAAMAALNKQTQTLLDEVGTLKQQFDFYARLSQMATSQNRYRIPAENIPLAQKALAIAQESGQAQLMVRQQFHLGFQLLWSGDLINAEEVLQQALAKAKALGDSWSHTQSLVYLTILYRFQSDMIQADAYLAQLFEIAKQVGNSLYIGVARANRAWLFYRSGEWVQAQTQAEAAIVNLTGSPYPFHWLAHWLLLALALRQNRRAEAIASARAMLDIKQQKLPDEIDDVLTTAVAAWDTSDEAAAHSYLKTAIELATQHGYL